MASTKLGVPVTNLTVSKGVVSGGGRSVSYGELIGDHLFNVQMDMSYGMTAAVVAARQVAGLANGQAPAKPVSQYTIVGTSVPRIDVPAKVVGTYAYMHNVKVALRDTLALLEALADDLSESRAEGAAEYLRNPEFRRVVDQGRGE